MLVPAEGLYIQIFMFAFIYIYAYTEIFELYVFTYVHTYNTYIHICIGVEPPKDVLLPILKIGSIDLINHFINIYM
jgi:hypothetical protein